jgi:uncharacterized protein YukE
MSGMQIDPAAATDAAKDLQRIAGEVSALLAEMRADLTAPAALQADDDTARSILEWYTPNAESLGKTVDVVAINADTLGNTSQQFIDIMQENDDQAKRAIQQVSGSSTSGTPDVRA